MCPSAAPDHRGAHQLADLHPHEASSGTRAGYEQIFSTFQSPRGQHRVVHGLQRHRKTSGLLISHVVGGYAM